MSLQDLSSFVPQCLVRKYNSNAKPQDSSESKSFFGTILFIDVSGFTALNEKYSKIGPSGAEIVNKHINEYFGKLTNTVNDYGGDVLKFAGDALVVMFGDDTNTEDLSLAKSTFSAVECAMDIQKNNREYKVDDITLTVHIGIGCGHLFSFIVGGENNCWEYLVAGPPFTQLEKCVDLSKSGETVISEESYKWLKEKIEATPRETCWLIQSIKENVDGSKKGRQSQEKITAESSGAVRQFVQPPVLAKIDSGLNSGLWIADLRRISVLFVNLGEMTFNKEKVTEFVTSLNMVFKSMQETIFKYEGFIRQFLVDDKGTVLIAAFGIPLLSHEDDIERAAHAALHISSFLTKLRLKHSIGITTGKCFCGNLGSLSRREYAIVGHTVNMSARLMKAAKEGILVDQKTFLGSQHSHQYEVLSPITVKGAKEPVPVFRMKVAETLKESKSPALARKKFPRSIHTVGRSKEMSTIESTINQFTKHSFSKTKKEESSDTPNSKRKSRRESKSPKKEKRRKSKKEGKEEVADEEAKKLKKQKSKEEKMEKRKSRSNTAPSDRKLKPELKLSALNLGSFNRTRIGGITFIEGEAGIGKSTLMNYAEEVSQQTGHVIVLRGDSSAIDKSTPLYPFRRIYQELLSKPAFAELQTFLYKYRVGESSSSNYSQEKMKTSEEDSTNFLRKDYEMIVDFLPLFNIVLNTHVPENNFTRYLGEGGRAVKTVEGLARWMFVATQKFLNIKHRIILFIEDAHWLDSVSEIDHLMVFVSTRPLEEPLSAECRMLYKCIHISSSFLTLLVKAAKLEISRLSEKEVEQLVCNKMTCDTLDEPLSKMVVEKSLGNPFFATEILQNFLENRSIEIKSKGNTKICRFTKDTDLSKMQIPSSIEQVILSRIDKLSPSQQTVLKVASCLGMDITPKILSQISPTSVEDSDVQVLLDREFFVKEERQGTEYNHIFMWKHKIMQEAIYNGLTESQKKTIHNDIAEWYLSNYDEVNSFYSLLANHFKQAGKITEAVSFSEKAADECYNIYARKEAIDLFTQAIQLDDSLPEYEGKRMRHCRWYLKITESCVTLAAIKEGKAAGAKTLELAGQPFLFYGFKQKYHTVKQLVTQLIHFKNPAKFLGNLTGDEAEFARIAAKVIARIINILVFEGESIQEPFLRAINLAELAGNSPELCFAYFVAGFGFGVPGQNVKMADEYFKRAEKLLEISDKETAKQFYLTKAVYEGAYGHWESAIENSRKFRRISDELGDTHNSDGGLALEGQIRAAYKPDFLFIYENEMPLVVSSEQRCDFNFGSGFCANVLMALLELDRMSDVKLMIDYFDEKMRPQCTDVNNLVMCGASITRYYYRMGDIENCLQGAEVAVKILESLKDLSLFYVTPDLFNLCSTLLFVTESDTKNKKAVSLADRAVKATEKLTKIFKCADSFGPLFQGIKSSVNQNYPSAYSDWFKALQISQKGETHYYSGMILYLMGKHAVDRGMREKLFQFALKVFVPASSIYVIKQIKSEMKISDEVLQNRMKLRKGIKSFESIITNTLDYMENQK